MNKFLTYRTAAIAGWIGLALLTLSWFLPLYSGWERVALLLGLGLIAVDLAATHHKAGYEKGRIEALKVEIKRVWAEQEPFQPSVPNPLEAEFNRCLAAYTDDEPATDPQIDDIKARLHADKIEFGDGWTDRSIRDREYLLGLLEGSRK